MAVAGKVKASWNFWCEVVRPTRRRCPRLLLLGFVFLILCFTAYIGFTEKLPYRQFLYFHRATKVPQREQPAPKAFTTSVKTLKFTNVILGLEQDARKKSSVNSILYAQVRHAETRNETVSAEKRTADRSVVSAANLNPDEGKLNPVLKASAVTQNQAKPMDATQAINTKQSEVKVVSVSHVEGKKNESEEPKLKRKKPPESKHVMSAHSLNQTEEQGTTKETKPQQLGDKNATSSTKPLEQKQSRGTGTTKKQPIKAGSFSVTVHRNVSVLGTQQVTRLLPTGIHKNKINASEFKSEPHWDFDDQYLLDNSSSQSSCPDSLRVKAAKSNWLKNIFLPNITLFIDRNHFNDSEWERMEHFSPPYGFMELNYSLVKEVISLLPPKPYHQVLFANNSSRPSRCISCAVVGNGGILNNSRMGQEIDSHDYVFRVSGAVIKGYEKDVGTRTSFYGFTAYSLVASLMVLGNRGFKKIPMGKDIKYLHFLEGRRDYEWLKALLLNKEVRKGFLDYYGRKPREKFHDNFSLDKYFVIHPDFIRYMKNRFLRSKTLDRPYWRLYRPTTGAFLLLTALHLCDQVSAYGYITEGYQKYSDHYYDKEKKRLIFYTNHDFDLERRVWKQLHDANIMKLYQRS